MKSTVPPDRLLVFSITDGWEPLCKFLDVSVPKEPFPHENAGIKTVEKLMQKALITDLIKLAWPWLVGLVVVIVLLYFLGW